MEKLLEKIFGYIEKALSPSQLWFIIAVITGGLFFLPENLKMYFGVFDIVEIYKGYIAIVFLFSTIVLIVQFITFVLRALKKIEIINGKNLNDEEKAILFFFITNQYQNVSLDAKYPAIVSLKNRNFIKINYSFVIYAGKSNHEICVLTKSGKKKIQSTKFQQQFLKGLDNDKVLNFVNSISDQNYSSHTPQKLD